MFGDAKCEMVDMSVVGVVGKLGDAMVATVGVFVIYERAHKNPIFHCCNAWRGTHA